MTDTTKFFDVITELFKDSIINMAVSTQENGQVYHWLKIVASFPLNEIHRNDIFLKQIGLCSDFCWLGQSTLERNNRTNTFAVEYAIGIGDVESFLKLATEKLAWSAYSQNFDALVEKELEKTT